MPVSVEQRLRGGFDQGATLVDGTVRRTGGPWTSSVHLLLAHLENAGFTAAPRPLGTDEQGREVLTHLPGETVGDRRPWPDWTHSEQALVDVGGWLRDYHAAVADFEPPADAVWREGGAWRPGLVIAHNDAAPYNAIWDGGLVGFVDWDMAGPTSPAEDLAWMAFSWVPLHARELVAAEGFHAFETRRSRLERFLGAYGWTGTTGDVLRLVTTQVEARIDAVHATAEAGDDTYRRMLEAGVVRHLESALRELRTL